MSQAKKLFNKNYFLLWQGQTVSKLGTEIYFMAMVLYVVQLTDSPGVVGLMGMIAGIPAVVLTVFGGVLADRYSRKRIIVICDLYSGVAVLSFAVLLYSGAQSVSLIIGWLIVVAVISSSIGSFFAPAISASIPDLVPKEKLAAANSLGMSTSQIAMIMGRTVSGFLLLILGAPLLVLINSITFFFSAISESFIKIPQRIPENVESFKERYSLFKKDIFLGFQYVWGRPGLKKLIFTNIIISFFGIMILPLLPFYIEHSLHISRSWFGVLMAFQACGSLLGYLIAGIFRVTPKFRSYLIIFFILLNGVIYIILGFTGIAYLAAMLIFILGMAGGFILVHINTIMQLSVESEIRGRVFGFVGTIAGALSPLGMGIAGMLGEVTNNNFPLIFGGCGLIILLVSLYILFDSDIRQFLAYSKDDNIETKANE